MLYCRIKLQICAGTFYISIIDEVAVAWQDGASVVQKRKTTWLVEVNTFRPSLHHQPQLPSCAVCHRCQFSVLITSYYTRPICCHWSKVTVFICTFTLTIRRFVVSVHRRCHGKDAFKYVTSETPQRLKSSGLQLAAVFISYRSYHSVSVPITSCHLPSSETSESRNIGYINWQWRLDEISRREDVCHLAMQYCVNCAVSVGQCQDPSSSRYYRLSSSHGCTMLTRQ